eukprot:5974042-Pleurochrysis_carterae.AAC.2
MKLRTTPTRPCGRPRASAHRSASRPSGSTSSLCSKWACTAARGSDSARSPRSSSLSTSAERGASS